MAFKFRIPRRPIKVDLPSFPSASANDDPEELSGMVNGMQASAPEERMAKALDRAGIQYLFRYTVGAPRGLPGWKELDFLISTGGMLQAVEVDTAFTHRNKQQSDILHDAIILNDKEINSYGTLYPQVMHANGDTDLSTQQHANQFVNRSFSRSPGGIDAQPQGTQQQKLSPAPSVPVKPTPVKNAPRKKRIQIARAKITNKAQQSKIDRMDK